MKYAEGLTDCGDLRSDTGWSRANGHSSTSQAIGCISIFPTVRPNDPCAVPYTPFSRIMSLVAATHSLDVDRASHLLAGLSKVNRVAYGLLSPAEVEAAQAAPGSISNSRIQLAIPFVGKDAPSPAADFAQPDVTIGFTILAYELQHLRDEDIDHSIAHLLSDMHKQHGPLADRAACTMYNGWMLSSGAEVCGVPKAAKEDWDAEATELRYDRACLVFDCRRSECSSGLLDEERLFDFSGQANDAAVPAKSLKGGYFECVGERPLCITTRSSTSSRPENAVGKVRQLPEALRQNLPSAFSSDAIPRAPTLPVRRCHICRSGSLVAASCTLALRRHSTRCRFVPTLLASISPSFRAHSCTRSKWRTTLTYCYCTS